MDSPQAALFAAFGTIGLLVNADFAGTWQRRLQAYVLMGLSGAAFLVIGWAAAQNPVSQVLVTAVVAFLLAFAAVLRGRVAAGAPGVLIVFIVAITFGGPASRPAAVPCRLDPGRRAQHRCGASGPASGPPPGHP